MGPCDCAGSVQEHAENAQLCRSGAGSSCVGRVWGQWSSGCMLCGWNAILALALNFRSRVLAVVDVVSAEQAPRPAGEPGDG